MCLYIILLFAWHIFVFLRHKYNEMIRQRIKAQRKQKYDIKFSLLLEGLIKINKRMANAIGLRTQSDGSRGSRSGSHSDLMKDPHSSDNETELSPRHAHSGTTAAPPVVSATELTSVATTNTVNNGETTDSRATMVPSIADTIGHLDDI
jgi:hypothetical protein